MKRMIAMLALLGVLLVPQRAFGEDELKWEQIEQMQVACRILITEERERPTPYECIRDVLPSFIAQIYYATGQSPLRCSTYTPPSIVDLWVVATMVLTYNDSVRGAFRQIEDEGVVFYHFPHPYKPCVDA